MMPPLAREGQGSAGPIQSGPHGGTRRLNGVPMRAYNQGAKRVLESAWDEEAGPSLASARTRPDQTERTPSAR
jgi:hypothetical protein